MGYKRWRLYINIGRFCHTEFCMYSMFLKLNLRIPLKSPFLSTTSPVNFSYFDKPTCEYPSSGTLHKHSPSIFYKPNQQPEPCILPSITPSDNPTPLPPSSINLTPPTTQFVNLLHRSNNS